MAGVSPPTGAVPGAGCAAGALAGAAAAGAAAAGAAAAGDVVEAGALAGTVATGVVLAGEGIAGGVLDGADCAHVTMVSASANPARTVALQAIRSAFMTSPPAQLHSRSFLGVAGLSACQTASLHRLDAHRGELATVQVEFSRGKPAH